LRCAKPRRTRRAAARQAEDAEKKRRKKEAEAVAEAKAPEEAGRRPPAEGTLHAHRQARGEGAKGGKEGQEAGQGSRLEGRDGQTAQHQDARMRAGLGWRERKARHAYKEEADQQHAFAALTEPLVKDITVPETITVADLAHKMSMKAAGGD
jgi:translation initiation factor IF-2